MWRFPFINTGCLNATYYFSDRLGEARTQSVAGRNKITLQKLFLLLMTCSGGACPHQARPHPARPTWLISAGPSPPDLSLHARLYLAYHRGPVPTWLIIARSHLPGFPSQACPRQDHSPPYPGKMTWHGLAQCRLQTSGRNAIEWNRFGTAA
jgi:hypothetical protein